MEEAAQKVVSAYAKRITQQLEAALEEKLPLGSRDKKFLTKVSQLLNNIPTYTAFQLDAALDAIDLSAIYEGVDKREQEQAEKKAKASEEVGNSDELQYEDLVVLEVLKYFKQFFKWVTKPECPVCKQAGDNIVFRAHSGPPTPNPARISVVENYRCTTCSKDVDFPRINNPVDLLRTRRGRCGEWVNCFMLVLQAVLGADGRLRYVWNQEDHVWCEYYSRSMKRWIHLDPCEGAYDEPSLYAENWGKKMSWVVGINGGYVIDLTNKYVTKEDKRIPRNSVVDNPKAVRRAIVILAYRFMLRFKGTDDFYRWWVLYRKERTGATKSLSAPVAGTVTTHGRQTGDAAWTTSRGENGA